MATNKKKGKNLIWILLFVLAALLIIAGGIFFAMKLPLGVPLLIRTTTPTVGAGAPTSQQDTATPAIVLQPANTAAPVSNCSQQGSMVILVTAADLTTWDLPHTADFIRYVRVDFSNLTVTAVSIPRDLWVQTPALVEDSISAYRLGEVYYYSTSHDLGGQHDKMIHATSLEAQTLYDNYGILPDHYITLDAGIFASIVDTLGGIDINNPASIVIDNLTFPAGQLHLTGDQASWYSRWMTGGTEWDRMARQKIIIQGVWNRLQDPANLAKIPSLLQQFNQAYVTDLSPEQITSLVCMLSKVPKEQVAFTSIGQDMVSPGPDNTLLPDTAMVKQFLQDQLAP